MLLKITGYDYARGNYRAAAVNDDGLPVKDSTCWFHVDDIVGQVVELDDHNVYRNDVPESCFGLLGGACGDCEHGITDPSTLQVVKCKLGR